MPRDNSLAPSQSSDWQGTDRPHGRRLPIYRLAGNSKKADLKQKNPPAMGGFFRMFWKKTLVFHRVHSGLKGFFVD